MIAPRLVLGSLAGLEAALAGEVRRWKTRDPLAPVTILAGSTVLVEYLRQRVARLADGHLNLRVTTAQGLALRLGEPTVRAAGRTPLAALGDRVLAEEAAARATGYFEPVARAPGFAASLHRLLRELRQASITPREFRDTGARTRLTPDKHASLADLYDAYERRRQPFYTAEDCFAAADPARFDSPCLLVYGLWRPTAAQRSLLERLMERVPVTVYLPATGTEADEAHEGARRWLAGLGADVETVVQPAYPSTSLAHLQARLFTPPAPGPLDGTVRLLSAPDPEREVREAARACLQWARDCNIPFHEMAVVYRHADRYRALVREVFTEAGIPVYLYGGRPVAEHPLGRRVMALLDLVGSPLRRSAVMEFLTETVLPRETVEAYGGVEPAAWDALSREAGIVEGRTQWTARLRFLAEAKRHERLGEDEEPDERLQAELDEIDRFSRFAGDLLDRLAARPPRGPWEGHLTFLRDLVRRYVSGGEAVLDVLADLPDLQPLTGDVSFERFRQTVRAALEERNDGGLPGGSGGRLGRNGVHVLEVNSLRHLRFRAVAVLGLAERSFPPPPRQDALLLDRERAALNEATGRDLPFRGLGPDLEALQFAMAVHAAEDRLFLSYARNEAGAARPHLPSHFFRAAAEALTGRPVRIKDVDGIEPSLYTRIPAGSFGAPVPEDALTEAEYDRTLLSDPSRSAAAVTALERRHPPFARARAAWFARWREPTLTPYDGVLTGAAGAALERKAGLWRAISPSRLETYATCPYRYFLQYVLRLEPVEEPEILERMEAMERGSLVHKVLERFLGECGEADPPRPERRDAHLARLRAIAAEECDARERRGLVGYPLLWQADRAAILEDLATWYDREAAEGREHGFRPGAFELRFGPAWSTDLGSPLSTNDPLELALDGVTLRFQGRIDRVDWTEARTAFRVIDYKTGGVSGDHRDGRLSGGRALQLPIYLLAASHTLGLPWERGEAQYFYVSRKGGFKRVRFTGSNLRERWDEFARLLRGLAESIAAGDFHAVPGDRRGNCRYCDVAEVCDARVDRLAARKAGDPRAEAFAALTEVE